MEKELHALNAKLKGTVSNMEKELHILNAKLGWFEYKLGETKHKLDVANLRALNLEEVIKNLDAKVELQKEVTT